MSDNNNRNLAFWGGLLLGGSAGALVALLTAPRSGKETRQILQKTADALPDMAEDISTTVKINSSRLSASTVSNWENTLLRLRQAITSGLEASEEEIKSVIDTDKTMDNG